MTLAKKDSIKICQISLLGVLLFTLGLLFGLTLLVDVTPHSNIGNPLCNAIFLESWDMPNTYDNYLLKTFLPYLEYLDSSKLNDLIL